MKPKIFALLTLASIALAVFGVYGQTIHYDAPADALVITNGTIVDGTDVIAVYNASREAVVRARNGRGPSLIECMTNRWRPQYEGASETRPEVELNEMRKKCPIKKLEKYVDFLV